MDNKDFDKIFSEGLQEEQDFGFKESDWEEVSERVPGKSKVRSLWWRWFIPLLLITFGAVVYCLRSDLNEARQEVLTLQTEVLNLQVEKTDTQYKKITIIEYDTIRQVFDLNETGISENQLLSYKKQEQVKKELLKELEQSREQNLYLSELLKKQKDQIAANQYKNGVSEETDDELRTPVALLAELPLKQEEEVIASKPDEQHFYLNENITRELKPWFKDRLSVGLTTAAGITDSRANYFYSRNAGSETKRFMLDFGLAADYRITDYIKVSGSVALDQIYLKTPNLRDAADTLFRVPYNYEQPLNNKVVQSALHYGLGVKFYMKKHRKWLPYGGLKITAQSMLRYKLKKTYSDNFVSSNQQTFRLKRSGFKVNSISQFFGYEYQMSKRFSWQIEQWFRLNLWRTDDQMYSSFGIRNTFLYHF